MVDLTAPVETLPLAFVDVETTGLDPSRGDRVCEIAVLKVRGGLVEAEWSTLVDPQRAVGYGAYRVNHISDADLAGAPLFAYVADTLLALVQDTVVVGHNTPFDLGFLGNELRLAQRPLPTLVALDTLALARRNVTSGRYSLGALCAMYGIAQEHEHRAMGDVQATRALFERLAALLRRRGQHTLADFLRAQGGPLRQGREAGAEIEPPPLIAQAMRRGLCLRIRYQDGYGSTTERIVQPIQLSNRSGQLFLVAHCYLRNAQRTFAVDRIVEMALEGPVPTGR